jgi:hypothetical protein
MASSIFCKLFFPDALYHHHEGPDKYNNIEKERVILDIVTIKKDLVFERILFSPVDLCHASDPRLHGEDLGVCLIIEIDLTGLMWTRSDE